MNSLSWLIYVAEVFGRLAPMFGLGSVVLTFGAGISFLATVEPSSLNHEEKNSVRKTGRKVFALAILLVVFACLLACSRPRKQST